MRLRLAATAMVALAIGALAVGCSSSSSPATPAANNAQGGNALTAYTDCLRQNGVVLPTRSPGAGRSPGGFTGGGARPTFSPGAGGGFRNGGGGGFGGGGFLGTQAPAGIDQATWTKATQACASLRPTAAPGGGGQNNSAFTAYRNCLSDHGVKQTTGPINTADPTYVAAEKACAPLRPSGRPRPSGTPAA